MNNKVISPNKGVKHSSFTREFRNYWGKAELVEEFNKELHAALRSEDPTTKRFALKLLADKLITSADISEITEETRTMTPDQARQLASQLKKQLDEI